MPKLSDLTNALNDILVPAGLDPKSVQETGRRLQVAGFIGTGKRGRYGGAEMTPTDAAAFLIGLVGGGDTRGVASVSDTVGLCTQMVVDRFTDFDELDVLPSPPPELMFGLPPEHTLWQALKFIIEDGCETGLSGLPEPHFFIKRLEISIERPWPRARIRVWDAGLHLYTAHYVHPAQLGWPTDMNVEEQRRAFDELSTLFGGTGQGYSVERTISLDVIYRLIALFRGEEWDDGSSLHEESTHESDERNEA